MCPEATDEQSSNRVKCPQGELVGALRGRHGASKHRKLQVAWELPVASRCVPRPPKVPQKIDFILSILFVLGYWAPVSGTFGGPGICTAPILQAEALGADTAHVGSHKACH